MSNNLNFAFKNDYNQICHPAVLQAFSELGTSRHAGYGVDDVCKRTADLLREHCKCLQAKVHYIVGGTLTNLLSIASFLRPHQAVIAVNSGHIEVYETGSIEATGHKIIKAQGDDGKLRPSHLKAICIEHNNEHMVQPKLVYISQSTELGTVYTKSELAEISKACKELNLYLYMDGARLGAAVTCEEDTPSIADVAKYCDAFYIGGTKNGTLFGEALLLVNEDMQNDFRYLCKQRGALLAKGFSMAAQFEALFRDGLYYELADNANKMAKYIDVELQRMGVSFLVPTYTNQIFPKISAQASDKLAKNYDFQIWEKKEQLHTVRFVTSWSTSLEDVELLVERLREIL